MRVDPEHAAGPVDAREPAERPDRDRVVAAEDERQLSRLERGSTLSATRAQVGEISLR